MKKTLILILLVFFSIKNQAQVIYSQNFDTALNWTVLHPSGSSPLAGWSRSTAGFDPSCAPFAGAGMARFNSFDVALGNAYSLTSPAIALTGANYRVTFKMFRDGGYTTLADKVGVYLNSVASTVGGQLLGTVNRSTGLSPTVAADGWYSYSYDLPAGVTGTYYISLLGTSDYGNNIFIDEIVVNQIQSNDAEMSTLNLTAFLPPSTVGSNTLTGSFKNTGGNPLTSIDINWQENGGVTNTQSLTGLNLLPGQSLNYNHSTPWIATFDNYTIHVWITNINGVADSDLTNNDITKFVSVASNTAVRFPLFEKFTSSTCPPCASFDVDFGPFYASNTNNFALINYQVNWPGTGDPYYTSEIGTRRFFYGVTGAPTMYIDADVRTDSATPALNSNLAASQAKTAYFGLNATYNLVGNDVNVTVNTTPYLNGTFRLFVAVVEKTTTGNATTNGETSFKNVLMKMMPDGNGTVLNAVHDVAITTNLTANVANGTYINPTLTGAALTAAPNKIHTEDLSDLEVIVFVQNMSNKMIMQAAKATNLLATSTFETANKVKLYPNPSTGIVKITTENIVKVQVVDVLGKVVYINNSISNNTNIDLSNLQKGVYLVKINGENINITEKLILN